MEPTGTRFLGQLQKFWPDGTPDIRFGQSGRVTLDLGDRDLFLKQIWVLPDGTLVIIGGISSDGFRLEPFVAKFFGTRKL